MIDSQRSKVYSWENKYVAPHDNSHVEYEHIQGLIDYVWQNEGYQYPPKLMPMAKQKTRAMASATRNTIKVHEGKSIPTWVVLHEVAHSITSVLEGGSNMHCEDFMGIYIKLLVKYLKLDLCVLMYTCKLAKVKYNLSAKPYFLD